MIVPWKAVGKIEWFYLQGLLELQNKGISVKSEWNNCDLTYIFEKVMLGAWWDWTVEGGKIRSNEMREGGVYHKWEMVA
jgi:hypothetical protein